MSEEKRNPDSRIGPFGRKTWPCEEVDPAHYLTNEEVYALLNDEKKLSQEDYKKIFNCVQCNECGTSKERMLLQEKFLKDGNYTPDNEEIVKNFKLYQTPYPTDKMRIKVPEGIPEKSDTLFYMGCLSTIRIWKYTEHALEYLLSKNIEFTIVNKEICCGYPLLSIGEIDEFNKNKQRFVNFINENGYKRIICLCPACFFIFNQEYPELNVEIKFIADYLEPSKTKKKGEVSIQHLCQLMNRGYRGVETKITKILKKSGYDVINVPHWCCGGGMGYVNRTDVVDKIAQKRMQDFKGDYFTTYCSGCYWVMRKYRKFVPAVDNKKPKLVDLFKLIAD